MIIFFKDKRDMLTLKYNNRMDQFIKRMIQRPNKINSYQGLNDYVYKDDMDKNQAMSVVHFNDALQSGGPTDANSYQAITSPMLNSRLSPSLRSLNSSTQNQNHYNQTVTQGSPIAGPMNPILGYSGSRKSVSVVRNDLKWILQPPMEFGTGKKLRKEQVEVSEGKLIFGFIYA